MRCALCAVRCALCAVRCDLAGVGLAKHRDLPVISVVSEIIFLEVKRQVRNSGFSNLDSV